MSEDEATPEEMLHFFDGFWINNNIAFLARYWLTATEGLNKVIATPEEFAEFRGAGMKPNHVAAVVSGHLEHHNYSGILLTYAVFDEFMLVLTRRLGGMRQAPILPSDLRDRGVKRYKKFIHQVCRISPGEADIDWDFLEDFTSVRHAIIHANGNLSHLSERPAFEKVIARHEPRLGLKHGGVKLLVSDQFVTDCLQQTKRTALILNRLAAAPVKVTVRTGERPIV